MTRTYEWQMYWPNWWKLWPYYYEEPDYYFGISSYVFIFGALQVRGYTR